MAILKNDWKAVGNNAAAKKTADWMNAISNLLNYATIPSGGTVKITPLGLQIEVDSSGVGAEGPLPFDVRVHEGNVEFRYSERGENAVTYNGNKVAHDMGLNDPGLPETGWKILAEVGSGNYVVLYLTAESPNVDWLDPNQTQWKLEYVSDGWQGSGVSLKALTSTEIAFVSGSGVVRQNRRGARHYNISGGDSQAAQYNRSSIEKIDNPTGSADQVHGFDNAPEPEPIEVMVSTIMLRTPLENPEGRIEVRYITPENLAVAIAEIVNNIGEGGWGKFDNEDPSLLKHQALADVADLSVGDDHRGGRAGITGPAAYLHVDGDGERNAMEGVIGDATFIRSIGPDERQLFDGSGTPSLDWGTQQPAIEDPETTQGALTNDTTGSAGDTLGAVGDTSAGDESGAINDNFASVAVELEAARVDIASLRATVIALRDAMQAYKIIAEPAP
jgi:hypothetical protein